VLIADDDDLKSDSDDGVDEHDLDNEAGDLGTEECDKLDEQMWGSDDEEPIKVTANTCNNYKSLEFFVAVNGDKQQNHSLMLPSSTSLRCYYATMLCALMSFFRFLLFFVLYRH